MGSVRRVQVSGLLKQQVSRGNASFRHRRGGRSQGGSDASHCVVVHPDRGHPVLGAPRCVRTHRIRDADPKDVIRRNGIGSSCSFFQSEVSIDISYVIAASIIDSEQPDGVFVCIFID